MPIHRLLLLMIAVQAFLVIGIGVRELVTMHHQIERIEQAEHTGRTSDLSRRAGRALAVERDRTAIALTRPDEALEDKLTALAPLRIAVDQYLFALSAEMETGDMHLDIARTLLTELQNLRDGMDQRLAGEAGPSLSQWLVGINQHIGQLHRIVANSGTFSTPAPRPLIRDVLFTLADYLGRERTTLTMAIMRGTPLTVSELHELNHYRANILHAWKRTDSLLSDLPHAADLREAIDHFWSGLFIHHEDLRKEIIESSSIGRPYPVDAKTWFEQASRGIDSVHALSALLNEDFAFEAARIREGANHRFALSLIALGGLLIAFVTAALVVRKRVLHPLRSLEQAVTMIAAGDLSPQPLPYGKDEFGQLAHSFEHMRRSLVEAENARDSAQAEMHKLGSALENSVSSIIITDARGIIEYTNQQFSTTTGYTSDEVRGRHVTVLKSGYTPPSHYQGMWETLRAGQVWKGELLNRRKNGELYWEAVSISPICDELGKTIHYISIQHDISDRKQIEARLDFMSSHDPLTRLANRSLLTQRFIEASATAQAEGRHLALLTLGIHRFKLLNHSLGHHIGDRVLCKIAARLNHATREGDTSARLSGSEFVVLLSQLHSAEEAEQRVTALLEELHKPIYIEEHVLQIALPAGISIFPDDGETLEELLTRSSLALHQSERDSQPNALRFYTPALDTHAQNRIALESALRQALATDQLELHYQPRVDLRSGHIVGAEALARWRHPDTHEYVPPDYFIPLSEESNLILEIGEWALREACLQNRRWQKAGLSRIAIAVNLSRLQLQQHDLPERISETLRDAGLAAQDLEIELTETALMASPTEAARALSSLRALGVRIAIDDFGTGYSSLSWLSRLPVDILKIDRSFVRNIEDDPSAATIASSVIALAHRMTLRVVAEGVENTAQLDFLREQDCDEIQGHYFSPALPAEEFAELLRSAPALPLGKT